MTTKAILEKVRDLIKIGWTNDGPARSLDGRRVEARSLEAIAWSLFGALAAVTRPMSASWESAVKLLLEVSDEPTPVALLDWSESRIRTQEEILEVLDIAVAKMTVVRP